MAKCTSCGAELPDYYTNCPNCGGQVINGAGAAPQPQAQPMPGYGAPALPQREITSVGGWFGWSILCGILPLIGPIIMLNVTKDQTAKNFAKLMIILQAIGIVLTILFAAVLVPSMIGYIEKSQSYNGYYFSAILPFLR